MTCRRKTFPRSEQSTGPRNHISRNISLVFLPSFLKLCLAIGKFPSFEKNIFQYFWKSLQEFYRFNLNDYVPNKFQETLINGIPNIFSKHLQLNQPILRLNPKWAFFFLSFFFCWLFGSNYSHNSYDCFDN